ncbi:MAG: hypothetical protein AABZ53_14955 [Planctomycetota bacterium]
MFFFGLYTVVVWWFAFVWRRRWQGWLALIVGLFGMLALRNLMARIPVEGIATSPLVEILLVPYVGALAFVGIFILVMPRPHESHRCQSCGYDMLGLVPRATCPECGRIDATSPGVRHKPSHPPIDLTSGGAVEKPQHQNAKRKPGDEHESQGGQA